MRQTYIAGTEPPDEPQIAEVAIAVDAWLAAKKKQALAAEAVKIRHETLLEALSEHGLERYPYHDDNGRKRYVVADKTPRAKTIAAPKKRDDSERAPKPSNVIEMRRVPRKPEHEAIADPFAATRDAMAAPKKRGRPRKVKP